jgi:hypothetical protein
MWWFRDLAVLAKRGSKWKSDKARHAAACPLEGLGGTSNTRVCEVQGGAHAGVSERVGKGTHQGGEYLTSILPSSGQGEQARATLTFLP